jgi:hypothetical protein
MEVPGFFLQFGVEGRLALHSLLLKGVSSRFTALANQIR